MDNRIASHNARRTVNVRLSLYLHLATYAIVNLVLAGVNYATSPDYLWFLWSLLGWGIGICFHAIVVFVFFGQSSLKERMLKNEMEKESRGKKESVKE